MNKINGTLVIINANLSKNRGFLILETYYADRIFNKIGKYKGGPIHAADINQCAILSSVDKSVLDFFESKCIQISKNSYFIKFEDLINLFFLEKEYTSICIDNSDRTIFRICQIKENSIRKNKYTYEINENILSYNMDGNLYFQRKKEFQTVVKKGNPSVILKYSQKEDIYSLYFKYNNNITPFRDKQLSYEAEDGILLRNIKKELEINEKLLKKGFSKILGCNYIYSGKLNKIKLEEELKQLDINLCFDDNIKLPKYKIRKSESGWFDIDFYSDKDLLLDLSSQIQLFADKNEIVINDKHLLLPESFSDSINDIVIENGKFRIRQKNLFQTLRLLYESENKISDFYSTEAVKIDIPEENLKIAYPYQLDGIKWLKFLWENKIGGCLADDMGLGKTFQIISFLEDKTVRAKVTQILIIVPKTLITNWMKEFRKFSCSYNVGVYHGDKRNNIKLENFQVIITTYGTAYKDIDKLTKLNISISIFDEIQILKNYKSVTSEVMRKINSSIKIGLSGTPMENNIGELWNIMDLLNPDLFKSRTYFLSRYNNRNYDELTQILNIFVMRRMKETVLKQLPKKNEQIVYCDMDKKQRQLYEAISLSVKKEIKKMGAFSSAVVLKGLLLLRECCCHPRILKKEINVKGVNESCKIDNLKLLISSMVEMNHKVLIFSQFTTMLHEIEKELFEYKEILYYLDGNTKKRSDVVNNFEKAERGIFLISIKAGGVGLNLTSAQDVIIFDPWWNPFVEQQAIDRVYRIGQKNNVNVYRLVVANTLEERIIEMQDEKKQDFDEIINGITSEKKINLKTIMDLI